jgi:hypothetical protein
MRLAASSACDAPRVKLRDYLLDQMHPDGGPKARFFEAFGYSPANITEFAAASIDHAADNEIASTSQSKYGLK